MYILAKFSNWHLKGNVLVKMIVVGNGGQNLCREKCILTKIPIACACTLNSQNASQLLPALRLWGVEIQTSAKPRLFRENNFFLEVYQSFTIWSRDPQWVLMKEYFQYFLLQTYHTCVAGQIQNNTQIFQFKRGFGFTYTWSNEA